jgi:hypothetical protein
MLKLVDEKVTGDLTADIVVCILLSRKNSFSYTKGKKEKKKN